ncbi:uncharacterized protein LOC100368950 [Saccoglossus kowalevskii]|uniref:Uncharacterized protein LOC100368950 n=1 Tax=Saccoglossus kowalevskii TaxID=10224 RepID=A0ABM0MKG0_SACKO|nr:PREDICTED: uncharacterized protein LOC100368950 [Saccoglossus kowalevskii]
MDETTESNGEHLLNGHLLIGAENYDDVDGSESCERGGSVTGDDELIIEQQVDSVENDCAATVNNVCKTSSENVLANPDKINLLNSQHNGKAPPIACTEVHVLNNVDDNEDNLAKAIEQQTETNCEQHETKHDQVQITPENEEETCSKQHTDQMGAADGEAEKTLVSNQTVPAVRPKDLSGIKPRNEESEGGEWRADPHGSTSGSLPLHGTVIREGDMVSFIADNLEEKIRQSFSPTTSLKSSDSNLSECSRRVQKIAKDESTIPKIDPHILEDLEKQAKKVADNLDLMMGNLKGTLHNMSAISVGYIQTHRDSVNGMGEAVDNSVKSMYTLIAKCEELNKNMQPIYQLSRQIKEIKRRLDLLEMVFK